MGGPPKIMGFPPKWMVYIGKTPLKWDDLGEPIFLETPIIMGNGWVGPRKNPGPTCAAEFKVERQVSDGVIAGQT